MPTLTPIRKAGKAAVMAISKRLMMCSPPNKGKQYNARHHPPRIQLNKHPN
jgi:hypothetical protein